MGMLDSLFEPRDPNTFQMGGLPHEDDPSGYAPPVYDDYSQGVPVRKKPEKVFNEELKKFQETHPLTPQAAAAAAPGMLGPEMGGAYGALPGVSNGQPVLPASQQPELAKP